MDRDADFTAFASARWPALVRSGVVLGCTPDDAHDLAQTTLVRCYAAWRKVVCAENQDAYVYRMLLNCHRDSRRRHWWGERPTEVLPEASASTRPSDFTTDVATTDAVSRALAHLSAANREVMVLRFYAHLSEHRPPKSSVPRAARSRAACPEPWPNSPPMSI